MKLLIVEDDRLMQEVIADYFGSKGWETEAAGDGELALEKWEQEHFQLVLLDVMMPGMNGFTVCRKIRERSDVPVIFITARAMEEDELHGYSLGADDYVTKPFSLPVLYAKAMALMGRVRGDAPHRRIRCGCIEADVRTHEVWVRGERCILPPIEYGMLLFFMENPNRVFGREQLLIRFWGYDFEGNERIVDNHIKKLRKALGDCGGMIQTVRKAGYRMAVVK
ncbi:MAG: response regulator transcription factor [Lachnospiraceae bacterium]|nr:response regulator transcription factor [Lachnospiraceae bacterium]